LKVAIDPWVLASRFRHQGTYVYAQSLIAEFGKLVQARPELQFCLFTSPRSGNDAGRLQAGEQFEIAQEPLLSHDYLWRLGGAGRAAARANADLMFAPAPSVFPFGRVPVVCTIHDATPVVMPSHSKKVTLLQRSVLRALTGHAQAIITVSECSRNDLVSIYGIPESKVFVIYNGYDKTLFNDAAPNPEQQKRLLARLQLDRPYILHHGTIQPRKNLTRLIEAYRLMLSRNTNFELDLVLAGEQGWECEEILAAARATGKPGRIVLAGALDGPDLALLIKAANLVVMPSLYEGFCLPMVEAMACGVPVVASDSSCLPEISGGVLNYFDPCSVEDMAACIEQAVEDEELRKRLVKEGKRRAGFFDWRRCAEETIGVFQVEPFCGRPSPQAKS
jgi:glycosyltransferase involved in cell wall biosynthesis